MKKYLKIVTSFVILTFIIYSFTGLSSGCSCCMTRSTEVVKDCENHCATSKKESINGSNAKGNHKDCNCDNNCRCKIECERKFETNVVTTLSVKTFCTKYFIQKFSNPYNLLQINPSRILSGFDFKHNQVTFDFSLQSIPLRI